jgi:anti-sigma B factor antagonist
MKYSSKIEDQILMITLDGDMIGVGDSLGMIDQANDAINEGVLKLTIDLSTVRYMNSSGIGILVSLYTKFKNKGGAAVLVNPTESTKKILSITKLDAIIPMVSSLDEAKKIFNL